MLTILILILTYGDRNEELRSSVVHQ